MLTDSQVSWIYQSEIFPMNIRALGASVSTASNWVSYGDYLETIRANTMLAEQRHHRPSHPLRVRGHRMEVLHRLRLHQHVQRRHLLLPLPRDEEQDSRGDWQAVRR